MEDAFHEIEDKAPRVIKNIKFPGSGKKVVLTDEERVILSFFAAIQLFRVLNYREGIEDMHGNLVEITLDHIVAKEGSTRLLEKVWHFAVPADGMTFVTSDNPVYFQTLEEYREEVGPYLGPMHPLSEVTLPLRKDLLLIFSPSASHGTQISFAFSRPCYRRYMQ